MLPVPRPGKQTLEGRGHVAGFSDSGRFTQGQCIARTPIQGGEPCDEKPVIIRLSRVGDPAEELVKGGRHRPDPHAEQSGEAADMMGGKFLHKTVVAGKEGEGPEVVASRAARSSQVKSARSTVSGAGEERKS